MSPVIMRPVQALEELTHGTHIVVHELESDARGHNRPRTILTGVVSGLPWSSNNASLDTISLEQARGQLVSRRSAKDLKLGLFDIKLSELGVGQRPKGTPSRTTYTI